MASELLEPVTVEQRSDEDQDQYSFLDLAPSLKRRVAILYCPEAGEIQGACCALQDGLARLETGNLEPRCRLPGEPGEDELYANAEGEVLAMKYYVYKDVPGAGKGWTLAVLAVNQHDADEYIKSQHKGAKRSHVCDSGSVRADCGAVTSAAGEEIKKKND